VPVARDGVVTGIGPAALLEVGDLVAEALQPEDVVEVCQDVPRDRAMRLVSLRAGYSPALSIRLPTTFSAAKYSAAISRAARQWPA
jgi:hypothetical protein